MLRSTIPWLLGVDLAAPVARPLARRGTLLRFGENPRQIPHDPARRRQETTPALCIVDATNTKFSVSLLQKCALGPNFCHPKSLGII